MQYTPEQQAIIHHAGGHARIIAVAGSGKTQTLTAYLHQRLQQGANPKRLLVLMYNKAAQLDFEARLRVAQSTPQLPDVRTFHSLGYRICQTLMRQGDLPNFDQKLLADGEKEVILWRLMRETAAPDLADEILSKKKKWVEPMMGYLERVQSTLETPQQVFEQSGLPDECRFFIQVIDQFERWRQSANRMSFADLLREPVLLFLQKPELAQQFSGHMDEIIVDEYQDINPVQQALIDVLRGDRAQLMVVGDPDQTIYEFRGSKPALLTHGFSKSLPNVTDYTLSHTFRFGHRVSVLANQVIAGNYDGNEQRTLCVSHASTPPTEVGLIHTQENAQAAINQIKQWCKMRPVTDIAVINRLWANSARIELLLLCENLPYRMDNQQTVLERYELRPFRVLFEIAAGAPATWGAYERRNAWQTLLSQPYLKIKKAIVDEILASVTHSSGPLGKALRDAIPSKLSNYQSRQLEDRARIIDKAERAKASAYEVVQGWTQVTDYYSAIKDNAFSAAQVDEQIATVKAFATFVRQRKWPLIQIAAELTLLGEQKPNDDEPAILITSIHKSKGRQWPCVIIPEVNNRFYPYQPEGDFSTHSGDQSDRRLLYVAATRAIESLVLVVPETDNPAETAPLMPHDFVNGLAPFVQHLQGATQQSPNLPAGMEQATVNAYAKRQGVTPPNWAQPKKIISDWAGEAVEHPHLGRGLVLRESSKRMVIRFEKDGREREFDRALVLPLLSAV